VTGVYAPVEGQEDDTEEFYNLLQNILETTPKSDLILVMGDLNARVGNNKTAKCIGKQRKYIYRNGETLIHFQFITN
jgi:hypothetical protein